MYIYVYRYVMIYVQTYVYVYNYKYNEHALRDITFMYNHGSYVWVHHVCIPTLISLARELARAYDAADKQDRDPRDSGSRKRTQLARPDRMARFGHTIGSACSHPKLPLDLFKINQWIPVDWVWRAIMSFGQNQKQGILSHLLSFTINQPLFFNRGAPISLSTTPAGSWVPLTDTRTPLK